MSEQNGSERRSYYLSHQDAWYDGIERAMEFAGNAQKVAAADLIRAQNAAIRDAWVATGNYFRQAMTELSDKTNIYPEETKMMSNGGE